MKLTLRDLFWLVLVCAMGCAWLMERGNGKRLENARQQMKVALDLLQEEGYGPPNSEPNFETSFLFVYSRHPKP